MQKSRIDYGRLVQEIVDKCGGNQSEAAKILGRTQSTISRWINKKQVPEIDSHRRILHEARELGIMSADVPLDGTLVPIVGFVQAGGEAIIHAEGQGPFGEAGMPPKNATEYTVAVVVRGDSMPGVAQDGWHIYYDTRRDPPTTDMLGKLCVIGLSDGRILVKQLLKGSKEGLYHLISSQGSAIVDQKVAWAARVSWIEPN